MKHIFFVKLCLLLGLTVLTACGGGSTDPGPPPPEKMQNPEDKGTNTGTGTGTGTATDFTGASVTGATTYRITFTQAANGTNNAGSNADFKFGAQYALPGEQVFSFVSNPGNTDTLPLDALKELTATSIGGRGTFPNGPDVLAINVYKVAGSNTNCNVIIRWGEAQA